MAPNRANIGTNAVATLAANLTWDFTQAAPDASAAALPLACDDLATAAHNVCLLRLLARIAQRFESADVPLMALKGAALHLTILKHPGDRPMTDIDLMVRPEHAGQAVALLRAMGCRPGRPFVRADFFPRFYYETEFTAGRVLPLRIDLHVRPFRPLRYAKVVPPEAFWSGAERVRIGDATVYVPGVEDMLIHLATHSAIHGNARPAWLDDLRLWADTWHGRLDWGRLRRHARAWRLTWPVHRALTAAENQCGPIRPAHVQRKMAKARTSWRDRLAVRAAPEDAARPAQHVLTNALCTPSPRFVAAYLHRALIPDRRHMAEWYDWRHVGWLACAHALRIASPLARRIPGLWNRLHRAALRDKPRGMGIFATRVIQADEAVMALPHAVSPDENPRRAIAGFEQPGKLRYLNHSCRPSAVLRRRRLVALKLICPGDEITVDYGVDACACRRDPTQAANAQPCAAGPPTDRPENET